VSTAVNVFKKQASVGCYTPVQLIRLGIPPKIVSWSLKKEKNMAVKMLQIIVCAVSLVSLQGCFSWHSSKETTDHDRPDSQTTTVYQHPSDGSVDVTTTTH
jgi:hypothetical protein